MMASECVVGKGPSERAGGDGEGGGAVGEVFAWGGGGGP
jgi:hypothetical protein